MSFCSPQKSERIAAFQTPLGSQKEPTKESLRLSQAQLNSQKKAQSEAKKTRNDEATFNENIARIKNSSLTQTTAFAQMQSEYAAYKNKTQLELQAANKKILELTWEMREASGVSSGKEAQLASDLQILTEQIDYLRGKCAEETEQKKKLFELIESFQYQNKILQEDKRKLELTGMQSKNNQETKLLKLEGDLNLSNSKLSAVEQEKRELEQKFLNVNRGQIEVMVKDLENQLRKVDIQSALLKNEIFELKKDASENKHLLEMAQMESNHKQAQIDQQIRIIEQLNEKQGVLLSQEMEMKQSIQEINGKNSKGDIKEKELKEEISVLKERNGKMKDKCEQLEKQNGLLVEQLARMQEDVREAKEERRQVLQEQLRLQEKYQQMETMIAEMQQVMQRLEENRQKLEGEGREKDKEIDEKVKEIERQAKELEILKEEIKTIEKRLQERMHEEEQIKMEETVRQKQWSETAQSDRYQVMHTHRETNCQNNSSSIMTPQRISLSSEKNTPFRIRSSNKEKDSNIRSTTIKDTDVDSFMNMIKIVQIPQQENAGNLNKMEKVDVEVGSYGKGYGSQQGNGSGMVQVKEQRIENTDGWEEKSQTQQTVESMKQDKLQTSGKDDVGDMMRKESQSEEMKEQRVENRRQSQSTATENNNRMSNDVDSSRNMNRNSNEQDLLLDAGFVESQKHKEGLERYAQEEQQQVSDRRKNSNENYGNNTEEHECSSLHEEMAASKDQNTTDVKMNVNQISQHDNAETTEMIQTSIEQNYEQEAQMVAQVDMEMRNTYNNDTARISETQMTSRSSSRNEQIAHHNIDEHQEQSDQSNQQEQLHSEEESFDEQKYIHSIINIAQQKHQGGQS